MASKLTKKDRKILQYVCENFSCKICDNILMQCVTLSCGHNYCSYCLDLLHSGMQHECPECASPIRCAQANSSIDQKIDNMLSSCSEFIQKSYASALDSRFQKAYDRNLARRNNARMNSGNYNANEQEKPNLSNCLDEIRNTLQMNDINPQHSVSKSLKSARKFQSHRKAGIVPERPSSSRPRSKPAPPVSAPKPCENPQASSEIDINKANLLFGIYDHVLGLDNNEPNQDMAAGDFARENDVPPMNNPILEGLSNYTKRSEVELEQLIKETDDIIRLDGHIQEWTNKMKNALYGSNESVGLAENKDDKSIHAVDDELWKASNELLQKLQGIQKQRKIMTQPHLSLSVPSIPVPRSAKVNFEALSDDSDEESYDNALMDILNGCLENPYDFSSIQSSSQDSEEDKVESENIKEIPKVANAKKQSEQRNESYGTMKKNAGNSYSGNRSARKKSILESMEESGHNYIKENIEFITQMRKYKEALMKIQNREVVTAQEIKELVPTTTFPSDGQDSTTLTKGEAPTTARRLSGPPRNHSYSARLPMSARLDHKPMTATATYDAPSTQSIRKQITSAPSPTSKQYLKRTRASNSIFTAR